MPVRLSLLSGLAAAVITLLWAAVTADSPLVRLDRAILELMHRVATDDLTALALGVTELAGTQAVLLIAAVAAAGLVLRGRRHAAVALVLAVGGTQGIVLAIKELVARARPPASASIVDAAGHAFPSAHAASSVALYGLLAFLLLRRLDGHVRTATIALTLAAVGMIGLTRIYLGAHYPSDVLAGWLVGAVVAVGAWQLSQTLRGAALPPATP